MTPQSQRLSLALLSWCNEFSKSDVFSGESNPEEAEIIRMCRKLAKPTDVPDTLYRGQAIADDEMADLLSSGTVLVPPLKRLVSSWTSELDVAMAFAGDAAEENFCSVMVAVPSCELQIIVRIDEHVPEAREGEFLAISTPLNLNRKNVVAAWRYDPESRNTVRVMP